MNRSLPIALSALLGLSTLPTLAGCKPQADVEGIRQALPQATSMQIKLPGATAARPVPGGPAGTSANVAALLGETARFYQLTRGVSVDLNFSAAYVLIMVRTIVAFPVTSVEGDTAIWGPWTDALNPSEYRLTVTETTTGAYEWSLEGRRKAEGAGAAYASVVAGLAIPGQPFQGRGSFTLDFDTAERLDPAGNDGQGSISIDYDLEADPRSVVMDYVRLETPPGGVAAEVTFHYEYREARGGEGDFVFRIHGDLDDDGSAWEDLDIRSRWLATGAGRSDVRVEGGDLGEAVLTGAECWDTSFGRVYWTDSLGWEPTEGDAAACAFAAAPSL